MEEQEQTIDLMDLLRVFRKIILMISVVTVLTAMAGFMLAKFVVPKKYTSETLMYVANSTSKAEDSAINVNDINAAQKLVNTCQILFTSDYILGELNDAFNGAYTVEKLKKMVTVSSANNTEVVKIEIQSGSPEESYALTVRLGELAKNEFMRVIRNGSIETVSALRFPESHTFPSATKFTAVGFLAGLFGSYFVYLLIDMMDIKIKPGDDLLENYDIPVFDEILDFKETNGTRYAEGSGVYKGYDSYGYK